MVSPYLEKPLRSEAEALADKAREAAELRLYLAKRRAKESGK